MKFKRILIKAPWDITVDYDEIDEKTIPKKHMLVKILYSSISPGTEIACIGGQESWFPLPNIPGYSAVARVEALGEEVSKFKVGDIVFAQAHHREYEIINSEGFVIKIPDGIDLAEASFMKLAEISITSLRTSDIELGDYVAVSGLGIIGNFAAQFANNQGGTVIAIDYSQNRLNLIKEMGIKHTINSSCDDVNAKIKEITEGHGIDTFIDATGIMPAIVEYIKYVKRVEK